MNADFSSARCTGRWQKYSGAQSFPSKYVDCYEKIVIGGEFAVDFYLGGLICRSTYFFKF